MEPAAGYKKARELPELRFGDKYKIAMAHVETLLEISPIKSEDAEALEKYSISLTSCKKVSDIYTRSRIQTSCGKLLTNYLIDFKTNGVILQTTSST